MEEAALGAPLDGQVYVPCVSDTSSCGRAEQENARTACLFEYLHSSVSIFLKSLRNFDSVTSLYCGQLRLAPQNHLHG